MSMRHDKDYKSDNVMIESWMLTSPEELTLMVGISVWQLHWTRLGANLTGPSVHQHLLLGNTCQVQDAPPGKGMGQWTRQMVHSQGICILVERYRQQAGKNFNSKVTLDVGICPEGSLQRQWHGHGKSKGGSLGWPQTSQNPTGSHSSLAWKNAER